jgi:hypothetical protein
LDTDQIETLHGTDLQDLLRGAIFCSTDKIDEDKKNVMHAFINLFEDARKLHQLRLALEMKVPFIWSHNSSFNVISQ